MNHQPGLFGTQHTVRYSAHGRRASPAGILCVRERTEGYVIVGYKGIQRRCPPPSDERRLERRSR